MSKHVPQLISKFEPSEKFNTVSWAPAGGWLVVYSASSSSGAIMFIDSNRAEPTRTNIVEYPGFNKVKKDYLLVIVFFTSNETVFRVVGILQDVISLRPLQWEVDEQVQVVIPVIAFLHFKGKNCLGRT